MRRITKHNTEVVFFDQNGDLIAPSVKTGDKVLLPEYGGTKVTLKDEVRCPIVYKANKVIFLTR